MSTNEPDETPVNPAHVKAFLEWYAKQTGAKGIDLAPEWWHNALKSLTLGQLRNGIRTYKRFTSRLQLSPVEFWGLCRGSQSEVTIERFRKLRDTVRNAPPPAPQKAAPKKEPAKRRRATP